jgi:predicted solute-binding protein
LPFVFAVWLLRPELAENRPVADAFRQLAAVGRQQIPAIAAGQTLLSEALARRYLTEHIRFELGTPEKEALARFRALLIRHHLLPPGVKPFRWV